MGHLVVAHAMNVMPALEPLSTLPKSIGWSLHRDENTTSFYLDTFKAGAERKWPFTSMPPIKDVPLELPEQLAALSRVYTVLESARLANTFKRAFLNLNLALSKSLQLDICSVCTDDDGLDFVCISSKGELQRLRCVCGDLEITYEPGTVTVQPLLLEGVEGCDVSSLHDPENGIQVLRRDRAPSSLLHGVASAEIMGFLKTESPPLGLGCLDGMEVTPMKIASSERASLAPEVIVQKAWWRWW
ncbi:hypothetical protein HX792_07235 [Pseudomonas sp. B6002]|uniref:hypothetical protein n=1 Tax=Pseudomonas sp. B6002 TaxID=2726978 RepID=UPI0015A43EFD|nr:hypothetical protein [Pseudomonas sp. B6002]NVZ50121.1 hypothetical protein [Pseudomonas sp. B6002]